MRKKERFLVRHRAKVRVAGYTLAAFVLINVLLAIGYHHRMYPRTTVLGVAVGNTSYKDAEAKLRQSKALPENITITYKNQKAQSKTSDLGVYIDPEKLSSIAQDSRSWLPVFNLLTDRVLEAPVRIDGRTYNQAVENLKPTFHKDPQSAHIVYKNGQFRAVQAQAGHQLDTAKLQQAVLTGISHKQPASAPVIPIPPESTLSNPTKALQAVQSQLNTPITFRFNSKTAKATPEEVASWYTQSGNSFTPSEDAIRNTIVKTAATLGVVPQNIGQAVATTMSALKNAKSTEVKLFAQVKTYTYCLGLRGVNSSHLSELEKRTAATYNDPRGWSLDGQVVFKQVSSGCGFTVWLTAANQMPSFGAICDAEWSCTVNNNVVINFDRWQGATSSWNAAKAGTLDEYRAMAINHETGHQLGFNHSNCPSPGQPAPLMEQQSIDLQGCTFNAWPTSAERDALRSKLGL